MQGADGFPSCKNEYNDNLLVFSAFSSFLVFISLPSPASAHLRLYVFLHTYCTHQTKGHKLKVLTEVWFPRFHITFNLHQNKKKIKQGTFYTTALLFFTPLLHTINGNSALHNHKCLFGDVRGKNKC